MSLFDHRPQIIGAFVGVYPPEWVPGTKVVKVCLNGVNDPRGDLDTWSDAFPSAAARDPATTWEVTTRDGRRWKYPVNEIVEALLAEATIEEAQKLVAVVLASWSFLSDRSSFR